MQLPAPPSSGQHLSSVPWMSSTATRATGVQPVGANWFLPATGAIAAQVSDTSHANRGLKGAPSEKPVAKTRRASMSMRRPNCARSARVSATSSTPLLHAEPLTQMEPFWLPPESQVRRPRG